MFSGHIVFGMDPISIGVTLSNRLTPFSKGKGKTLILIEILTCAP